MSILPFSSRVISPLWQDDFTAHPEDLPSLIHFLQVAAKCGGIKVGPNLSWQLLPPLVIGQVKDL